MQNNIFVLFAAAFVLLSSSVADADSVFGKRVEKLQAYPILDSQQGAWLRGALAELDAISSQSRALPTIEDLRSFLLTSGGQLEAVDYMLLWRIFCDVQRPDVTAEQLHSIADSHRLAAQTLVCDYEKTVEMSGKEISSVRRIIHLDRHKFRVAMPKVKDVLSFDGSKLIHCQVLDGKPVAEISHLSNMHQIMPIDTPLALAMLCDSEALYQREIPGIDLKLALEHSAVLEGMLDFKGRSCIAVGTLDTLYFLDPELGYACVGQQSSRYQYSGRQKALVGGCPSFTQVNTAFENVSSNLWLPKRMETTYSGGPNDGKKEIATVKEWSAPMEISNSVFADIIADGTVVNDWINGNFYRQGGQDNLEADISAASAKSKSSRGFLVALNIVAIVIIVAFLILKKRRVIFA